jgi:hypothetical protein
MITNRTFTKKISHLINKIKKVKILTKDPEF